MSSIQISKKANLPILFRNKIRNIKTNLILKMFKIQIGNNRKMYLLKKKINKNFQKEFNHRIANSIVNKFSSNCHILNLVRKDKLPKKVDKILWKKTKARNLRIVHNLPTQKFNRIIWLKIFQIHQMKFKVHQNLLLHTQ